MTTAKGFTMTLSVAMLIGFAAVEAAAQRTPPAIPTDLSYEIIKADRVGNMKCALDVRLSRKVSEEVLESLAMRLRNAEPKRYERMFITYYLPGMTAGAGVIHSEMPGTELMEKGGVMHGFQIWVNLPKKDKMIKPRYQDIPSEKIPEAKSANGLVSVRVIAGEAMGKSAVIETRTPIMYQHFTLQPGGRVHQPIPPTSMR